MLLRLYRITYSSLSFITTAYDPNQTSKRSNFNFLSTNMARSKPNKSFKSTHKQQMVEQHKQDKTDTTTNMTPQTTKTNTRATGTDERSKKRNITQKKYVRNPENIPYYEGDALDRRINRNDRNKQQLNEEGDIVNSSDDEFIQPSDEDAQGNVLTEEELASIRMSDTHQTPNKEDGKPAAQPKNEDSSPLPDPNRKRLDKREHEADKIKKLFASLDKSTQKQLKEQGERHAMEIAAMKRANLDTQNLLTTKTTPAQTMNDHRTTAYFNAMTKPSETLFDGTPENWPAFEYHLLTEAENPTISWNQDITNYQPTDEKSEPFNLLEIYFDLPDNMTDTLMNELADAQIIDLVPPASQLYKLHCLKNKLKNCLTTDLAHDIEASMPTGLSNKDGRLFFIKLVSHTFPDKEAHKRIIYEYILKLEITESNNMEGFTRELRRHIKQYDAIQGSAWKKITNHIIKKIRK
jgi:hypothetical protein